MFELDLDTCPEEVRLGLQSIWAEIPEAVKKMDEHLSLRFMFRYELEEECQIVVTRAGSEVVVQYGRKIDAFRGLGKLLGVLCMQYIPPSDSLHSSMSSDEIDKLKERDEMKFQFRMVEKCGFKTVGVMIDVSRNAVLTVKSVKTFVVRCALMGINMVMLYTEDTYEVSGEPFFGHLRGAYTESELKEIDDYAFRFGIEVVPCIQTLGHLEQMLHWPVYSHLRDTEDVILAENEGTYEFLTKIIKAASAPFRTSRIHLGMDEAEGLGTGRYRRRMGPKPAFDIFNAHLGRVMAICQDLKLKPMIWSDMYFRIGSETGDYYDRNSIIPEHVIDEIPKGVDLVYWDYYHTDSEFYSDMIDKHMRLLDGGTTVVAGAAWTWSRFWTYYPFSFTTTDAMMRAARAKGVKEVILTLWGDDGAECDYFSAFPAMQYFAEHAHSEDFDRARLRQNFMGSCAGYDIDSFLQVSRVDEVPFVHDPSFSCANISKWLMWEDIILGHLHPQFDEVESKELRMHYSTLSSDLQLILESEREAGTSCFLHGVLEFPFHVAKTLSLKVNLRNKIVNAYVNNEREALKLILDEDIVELMKEVDLLWKSHRRVWLSRYKPFGLELLEARYGALRCRIESLRDRLNEYLERVIDSIPELEVAPLKIYNFPRGHFPFLTHRLAVTPSR